MDQDPVTQAHRRDAGGEAGVTMIELLVVVAMLSVLAIGVTLPLRQTADPASADATLFQSVFARTRAQAVHGRQLRGLQMDARGLRLMTLEITEAGQVWRRSEQPILWQGRAVLRRLGPRAPRTGGETPDITFLPNGQTSAFEAQFTALRSPPVLCRSDGWSEATCRGN